VGGKLRKNNTNAGEVVMGSPSRCTIKKEWVGRKKKGISGKTMILGVGETGDNLSPQRTGGV